MKANGIARAASNPERARKTWCVLPRGIAELIERAREGGHSVASGEARTNGDLRIVQCTRCLCLGMVRAGAFEMEGSGVLLDYPCDPAAVDKAKKEGA